MATRRTAFAVEQLLSLRFNTPAVKEEARVDQKEEVHAKNSSGFQDQELHKLLNDLNQKFSSDSHEVDERKISPSERKKNGKVSEKKNSKSRGAKKVALAMLKDVFDLFILNLEGFEGVVPNMAVYKIARLKVAITKKVIAQVGNEASVLDTVDIRNAK
eukprot:CAMPEP_0167761396 /NCGR_PEP_ID=MMETSP0110_2-20121227/12146_1 /TAXON_ID=629695 /ORGANISM="Gymnochlora sp., Strain CCMP2014" /LENGTH=158 /DNA_ID=CAMNT_0007648069 /DNA_START=60 /DNA_END=537 /DNA_ORIENTATION=+